MLMQGAKVDTFGVGERLITASSEAVFGGVYKMAAIEDEKGNVIPKIKLSENTSKITLPGFKQCWRLFDRESGKAIADVITLRDETIDDTKEYVLFDPEHTWKRKVMQDFTATELMVLQHHTSARRVRSTTSLFVTTVSSASRSRRLRISPSTTPLPVRL